MNPKLDTHQFAFYTELVNYIVKHKSYSDIQEITDLTVIHRIINILRLKKGDNIILFDSHYNIKCTILEASLEKKVIVELLDIAHNTVLKPKITWLLPILKKEAFEEALYTLTEIGIQEIQPIITQKTRKALSIDSSRNKKILISAAEQSKQFILPNIKPLIPLELWLLNNYTNNFRIFFDIAGKSLFDLISNLRQEQTEEIIALAGPEGDLTQQEKFKLSEAGFTFCALTKTILRAQQAITLGAGALRSLL